MFVELKFRPYQNEDLHLVYQLLIDHGWQHRLPSLDFLGQLIQHSQLVYVVEHQKQIIGFARAMTDFLSNAYLSMFVINHHFQRQGIGTQLLQTIIATVPDVTWVLRAGRVGAESFFQAQGFVYSEIAMEKLR